MNTNEFIKNADKIIQFIKKYYDNIEDYPVKSQVKPYELYDKFPENAPKASEELDALLKDIENLIIPGITHWQSPKFFGYFPANTSEPSILGEMLTSAIAAQCMKWETSPIAAELEEKVLNWLKVEMDFPSDWYGVIQDSASSATLAAILTAREMKTNQSINSEGFSGQKFTVYCSTQTHSSIEKAVKIAGIGSNNLRKIDTFEDYSLNYKLLEKQIIQDKNNGFTPLCIVAAIGTTGSLAFDNLEEIGKIAEKYDISFHIDAAYAGTAMLLEEYRYLLKGIEYADTYVFNPHKWMFINFDLSVYFVKDKRALLDTFEIIPEYLKTGYYGKVNDFCDWGIPLGRRFRALKLWFVIRMFGIDGIKQRIRKHIQLGKFFEQELSKHPYFEMLATRLMNVIAFRFNPGNLSEIELNTINESILQTINSRGNIFISHTKLNGKYTLRFVCGQTYVEKKHIEIAINEINFVIKSFLNNKNK
jgi:aromatic-L-amino-acid decarboxylase